MRKKKHFLLGILAAALRLSGEDLAVAQQNLTGALAACPKCAERPVILGTLGGLLRIQGHYEKARPLLEEALRLREGDSTAEPVQQVIAMNRLILLYRDTAEHARAQKLAERAVALTESAHLAGTEEGAAAQSALGTLRHMHGDDAAARRYLSGALETRMKIFGINHASVAETVNNLAIVELGSGHLTMAERLYRRAIAILESPSNAKDPRLPVILNNLGKLLAQQGKRREAMRVLARALAASEAHHPDTAVILIHMAELQTEARKFHSAAQLLARAEAITRAAVVERHPRWAALLNAQAGLAFAEKRFERAEELYGGAKSILLEGLPRPSAEVAAVQVKLAEVFNAQHRSREAGRELHYALLTLESVYGAESPRLFDVLRRYSESLRSQMDYAGAASADARAMAIYVKSTLRTGLRE